VCGFVGLCKKDKLEISEINRILKISEKLRHRGPNQKGFWNNDNIFFGHRRLSINDLTDSGNQPMISASGRYIIIYNGEIYNFVNLRKDLENDGIKLSGKSDTEVILCLIDKLGFEKTIKKLNGMFAFALYDKKLNRIYLIRDNTGQKPLYFSIDNKTLFFTSELKGLEFSGIKTKISQEAVSLFFKLSYIPAPFTIFQNIFKLEKGKYLELNLNDFDHRIISFKRDPNYFELSNKTFDDKISSFENLFSEVISDHLISDVENGTLLSGGIDSTLVTLFSNKVSEKKIKSYCVKSNNYNYDESVYAEKIAKKIGTEHNTLEFTDYDFKEAILNMHKVYDEPFGDSSQIPCYLLFKSIKNKIQVAISGDGGDEIFYGYNRYLFLNNYFKKLNLFNLNSRVYLSKFLKIFSEKSFDAINNFFNLGYFNLGNKISKVSDSLDFKDLEDFYIKIVRQDYCLKNIVKKEVNLSKILFEKENFYSSETDLKNFQKADLRTYLADDIFVKVDRSSMYHSIECRAPFLDNRVLDFSNTLKDEDKIKKNKSKYFLKKVLSRHFLPSEIERPKMGFGNPIGHLLRSDLKNWADQIISSDNEQVEKYVNINKINEIWKLHKNNKKDYSNIIWNFLILKNWLKENEISQ
jgi:asparagine synthase (glutamine-hydrolysing)